MNKIEASTFSRREALTAALISPLIFGATIPAQADDSVIPSQFVPENDYPYFGYEPDGGTGTDKLSSLKVKTEQP